MILSFECLVADVANERSFVTVDQSVLHQRAVVLEYIKLTIQLLVLLKWQMCLESLNKTLDGENNFFSIPIPDKLAIKILKPILQNYVFVAFLRFFTSFVCNSFLTNKAFSLCSPNQPKNRPKTRRKMTKIKT